MRKQSIPGPSSVRPGIEARLIVLILAREYKKWEMIAVISLLKKVLNPQMGVQKISRMICEKKDTSYSKTIGLIRCKLSFSLLRSTIMAIRGARSSHLTPISLQSAEGHLQTTDV